MSRLLITPLVTEKSLSQAANGVYNFIVPRLAQKPQIVAHVTKQFGVHVVRIATSKLPAERVRFKSRPGERPGYKRAIIRLAAGETIAGFNFPQKDDTPEPATPTAPSAVKPVTRGAVTVRRRSGAKKA